MKCPKCHYLSFDPEPRCKNCGFSLSLEATDLPITTERAASGPLADLELRSTELFAAPDVPTAISPKDASAEKLGPPVVPSPSASVLPKPVRRIPVPRLDRARTRLDAEEREGGVGAPPATATVHAPRTAVPPTTELPLFVKGMADVAGRSTATEQAVDSVSPSVPLVPPIVQPAVPIVVEPGPRLGGASTLPRASVPEPVSVTAPISVGAAGESAPGVSAPSMWSGARRKIGPLDRDLLNDLDRIEKHEQKQVRAAAAQASRLPDAAGAFRRLGAAIFDGLVLCGILTGLLALTLRWTAIDWTNLAVLPVWPTAAFLTLVAAGYLLLFTAAAGQTPGKMFVGIRVVGAGTNGDGSEPLSASQACLRELVAVPAVLALGLGFLPALVGDERGVHDRIASTRVVRG